MFTMFAVASPTAAAPNSGPLQPDVTYTGFASYDTNPGGYGKCSYPDRSSTYTAGVGPGVFGGSLVCGGYLAVTGPKGTVRVEVVDQCAGCGPGDLNMDLAAFEAIGSPLEGRAPISWKLTDADPTGGLTYRSWPGSNRWWGAMQLTNSRYPVSKLEVSSEGSWKTMSRREDNYFLVSGVNSPPYRMRVTDIYGDTVVEDQVPMFESGGTYQGSQQFPQH
ncbi:expansin EXLX1 family cellulose-binding protein [Streptomyces sp. NPDC051555]|uniref:expansin EXLX1 family cellulose-binding protein n=1 Tax=Streptomyces sp. NPDC051555 TaxID=3365657 RepID=UPI00379F5ADE